jgi:hypothetical protein
VGYLEGLLGGFTERKSDVEKQTREDQFNAQQRESKILDALINSPDPEVKAHGIAGLLETANPKKAKGGLRGFLGEVQSNPHLDAIRAIAQQDASRVQPGPAEAAAAPPAAASPEPNAEAGKITTGLPERAPAAQAATSPTTGGAPPTVEPSLSRDQAGAPYSVEPSLARTQAGEPAQPVSSGPAAVSPAAAAAPAVGAPPPRAGGPAAAAAPAGAAPSPSMAVLGQPATPLQPPAAATAPIAAAGTLRKSRQFFQSPEGQIRLNEQAKTEAGIEGMRTELKAAGFNDAEIKEVLRAHFVRQYGAGMGAQSVAGEAPNAAGTFTPTFGVFDRVKRQYLDPNTGDPIPGFRPKSGATSQYHYGTELEAATQRMFNVSYGSATQEQRQAAEQEVETKAGRRQAQVVAATNAGKLDAPIGVTNALRYPGVPATATLRELAQRVPLSQQDIDKLHGVSVLDGTLDNIEALIPKVFPDYGPGIVGNLRTRFTMFGKSLGRDEDLSQLNASIASAMAGIVRANGITQRLNVKELELAQQQLANTSVIFGDTLESAQAKMEILRDLVSRVKAQGPTTTPTPGVGAPPPKIDTTVPGAKAPPVAAAPAPGGGAAPNSPAAAGFQMVNGVLYYNGKPY